MDLEKAGKIMIKTWEVRAEINMDASRYKTVTVKANTERKARQFAVEKLKADGAFFMVNLFKMLELIRNCVCQIMQYI